MTMGAPIERVVLAVNANRTIPDYLSCGKYEPRSSLRTLANAMDVGAPSNMERLFSLYPVDEKKKLIYFSNWIKKDRALLPKGSHLDNCPECGHPYPLEDEMFEKTHDISVRLFLQEFTMILPDGKRISFAETESEVEI